MSKYLLALNAHPKIGSQTLKKALAFFDENPEKLWRAKESEIKNKLDDKIASLIIEAKNEYDPESEIEKLQKLDVGYVTMYDKEYPSLLKEIPDHPAIIYVKGDYEALLKPSIAIVGSRKYTNYGVRVANLLTKKCSESGLVIVSGLALGIDAVAHKATLENNGITIGVLGALDRIYPVSNFQLGKEIVNNNGTIVSEYPPGTPPLKQNFPARNRIIAGLSLGTLVVEAAEKSGALITALIALEYGREVFAVPGNIDSENSCGTNYLIKKGAKLVQNENDIFEELNIDIKIQEEKSKKILPETEEEKKIVEILKKEKMLIDDIVKKTGLNIIEINTNLSLMEMKGLVENLGGGYYKLC